VPSLLPRLRACAHSDAAPPRLLLSQVACAFSADDAAALTTLELRRSADSSFPETSSTTTLGPLPAAALAGAAAATFAADDAAAPAGATSALYYSVRGATTGGAGAWSAPFAAVDGTAALFAAPGGAAAAPNAPCGAYATPCGAIADALALAAPSQPILLLPGTYAGAGNRNLTMAGQARAQRGRARHSIVAQQRLLGCFFDASGCISLTLRCLRACAAVARRGVAGRRGGDGAGLRRR
jgi:hypothetical protein